MKTGVLSLTTPSSLTALRHSKANWREASSGLLGSAGAVPSSTDFFGGILIDEDVGLELELVFEF